MNMEGRSNNDSMLSFQNERFNFITFYDILQKKSNTKKWGYDLYNFTLKVWKNIIWILRHWILDSRSETRIAKRRWFQKAVKPSNFGCYRMLLWKTLMRFQHVNIWSFNSNLGWDPTKEVKSHIAETTKKVQCLRRIWGALITLIYVQNSHSFNAF